VIKCHTVLFRVNNKVVAARINYHSVGGDRPLAPGFWELAAGGWLLVTGDRQLVAGHWSMFCGNE
jgi:hypothetical protein